MECLYSFSHHFRFSCCIMFQKKFFCKPKWGQGPPGPRSDSTKYAKRQNFFFYRDKDLYLLFDPRLSLILCCCFFAFKLFFGIFVKCFWQFGYAKFHSWCDYKLAIIKPSAYLSTYCLLIKWLIFSC